MVVINNDIFKLEVIDMKHNFFKIIKSFKDKKITLKNEIYLSKDELELILMFANIDKCENLIAQKYVDSLTDELHGSQAEDLKQFLDFDVEVLR